MAKSGQFNMFVRPIEGLKSLENVTNSIVPILWVEEVLINVHLISELILF